MSQEYEILVCLENSEFSAKIYPSNKLRRIIPDKINKYPKSIIYTRYLKYKYTVNRILHVCLLTVNMIDWLSTSELILRSQILTKMFPYRRHLSLCFESDHVNSRVHSQRSSPSTDTVAQDLKYNCCVVTKKKYPKNNYNRQIYRE